MRTFPTSPTNSSSMVTPGVESNEIQSHMEIANLTERLPISQRDCQSHREIANLTEKLAISFFQMQSIFFIERKRI